MFPPSYYVLIISYLENRTFFVKIQNTVSDIYDINAGVSQEIVLEPILKTLNTANISTT